VDNIAARSNVWIRGFLVYWDKYSKKIRVNPKIIGADLPMTAVCVIAIIVAQRTIALQHPATPSYPRFLWVTLWITMFTSRPSRASAGLVRGAL
jgi:hypothetical protein